MPKFTVGEVVVLRNVHINESVVEAIQAEVVEIDPITGELSLLAHLPIVFEVPASEIIEVDGVFMFEGIGDVDVDVDPDSLN